MSSPLLTLVLIPLGAVLFRIRGGWLNLPSTTLGRAVWSVGMTLPCVLFTWNWWLTALAPLLFLGCVLPWWGSIDMGRDKGSLLIDSVLQTLRGVLWILPAAGLLYWQYGWASGALVASGLLCAAAYEAGWRIPSRVRHFSQGSEIGEVIFGALIGAGMSATILTGG